MTSNGLKYFILLLLVSMAGCAEPVNDHFQGYIEGEYLRIAAPMAGQLEILPVSRGMMVATGDLLFTLDHSLESAAVGEAEQGLARAGSLLADLTKGRRPAEIKAVAARLAQARAAKDLAQKEFDRLERLVKEQSVSRELYDRAVTELQRANAMVDELTADLETAGLGSRSDLIEAARAEMKAARERLGQARWKLAQRNQNAPQGGLVFDTYYNPGEFVPAGYPVISLLPPGRVKLRFFIPETLVGTIQVGQRVQFTFDGAGQNFAAVISYISPQVEYTPPVIYSREARSKLVFMLEALPEPAVAAKLHPGQPIEVRLEQAS
ncbi:MAG: HlyD family efflux transporter periplasmic adaptor subunit [Proteobacteria bacterium]|nr:HlyD family efflux transporter periplasmic adaptor subunit [Pseudomonadota bacterium]MBU1716680.1 HlyD family efflux transporter periplasmic adaptor subunit [Pseudomonadota bacterium]